MDDFRRFMHPGPECKCCNPALVVKHPSLDCTCCLVDWSANGNGMPMAQWIQSKLDNLQARIAAQAKVVPKPLVMESDGHNIIIDNGNVLPGDALLLFGGWNVTEVKEPIHVLPASTTFADIMVKFAIFPSKGQAKKNGWDKPISDGWTELVIGKLKHKLWIWQPSAEWKDA